MNLTLRQRIILAFVPVFILLAAIGTAACVLLYQLGDRIDQILRENYDSVIYMKDLNEALERIDSSFTFTLAGQKKKGRAQYDRSWPIYLANLVKEQHNITLPGEGELVEKLTRLTREYQKQGDRFYRRTDYRRRSQDYFGAGGLLELFGAIKKVAENIRRLNSDNMEAQSEAAKETVWNSLIGFGVGLTVGVAIVVGLALRTIRTILRPVQAVTASAVAIGAGNLDQVVPATSQDELGQLANAFNTMARQLRDFRQSHHSQLFRAQQTSQATIDSFPDPVLVVDGEGQVELANPSARRLLGVRPRGPGAWRGVPWQPPDPLRQPLAAALQHQREYLPHGFDQVIILRDAGKERSYLPRLLPIRDPYGATLGAAVLLEDVTRFRLLDEVKSNLVATVSHELKTPLTGIRLVIHLLLEEATGPLTPKQLELVLDARDNAERLLAMIDNLLDLARLEETQGRLDLQPVQPAELLKQAASALGPRAEDQGVDLVVEAPPDLREVAADSRQLGHALFNLLDNALTHTPRGGRVTLSAEATGDTVTLVVADTGSGIPPEFLPHVFEKFFRIPGKSLPSGTGLGLAIVREIVTAHGGTVTCDSQPGKGTVFRLTLPVWSDAPAAAHVSSA
jgi:signal transduction histidine kinase